MSLTLLPALRRFARDSRGGAAITLGFGAVALLSIAVVSFDLYARVGADTTVARMAATMAGYVSRETAPADGAGITALGRFLHERELRIPADVVYVISVIRKPDGTDPATVSWVDTVQVGDAATRTLADSCGQIGASGAAAALPDGFTMDEGEVMVVAEVCARLHREGSLTGRFVAGDIRRLHALPARDPDLASARPTRPTEPEDGTPAST